MTPSNTFFFSENMPDAFREKKNLIGVYAFVCVSLNGVHGHLHLRASRLYFDSIAKLGNTFKVFDLFCFVFFSETHFKHLNMLIKSCFVLCRFFMLISCYYILRKFISVDVLHTDTRISQPRVFHTTSQNKTGLQQ